MCMNYQTHHRSSFVHRIKIENVSFHFRSTAQRILHITRFTCWETGMDSKCKHKRKRIKTKTENQNIGNAVGTQYHQNTKQPDFIENITHRLTITAEWMRSECKESLAFQHAYAYFIIVFIRSSVEFFFFFFFSFYTRCVSVSFSFSRFRIGRKKQ